MNITNIKYEDHDRFIALVADIDGKTYCAGEIKNGSTEEEIYSLLWLAMGRLMMGLERQAEQSVKPGGEFKLCEE